MAYEVGTRPDVDEIVHQTNAYNDGLSFRGPKGHMDAHVVAVSDADVRGVDQTEKHVEALPQTADLGWNKDADDMPESLLDGMSNEDYWILVRRFDNRPTSPWRVGWTLTWRTRPPFEPNKLRSQFERLYMGVLLGLFSGIKHVSRLRSWLEPRRTGAFCAVYFLAWHFNIIVTVLTATTMALIAYPQARAVLFPPAPLAMVDWLSGGIAKPHAGVLGSDDTATGAPQTIKGEAAENEASNFVTGIVGIAMNVMTAEEPGAEPENMDDETHATDDLPQPNEATTLIATAKDKSAGVGKPSHDKTKRPMEEAMWSKMLPLLRALWAISDTWERFANALSPVPPFVKNNHRFQLAAILSPILIGSALVPAHVMAKLAGLFVGMAFFGDPFIKYAIRWLHQNYPDWQEMISLNATILKGVPNNAQLTITLLRRAEGRDGPLPPAPNTEQKKAIRHMTLDDTTLDTTGADAPLGATQAELEDCLEVDQEKLDNAGGPDSEVKSIGGHKTAKVLNFLKHALKGGAKAALTADRVRAKAGRQGAKNRIGVVPATDAQHVDDDGPTTFTARYDGNQGTIHISPEGIVAFDSLWSCYVGDIVELRKHSGLGSKVKLAVGWAMERKIWDALEIKDRKGNAYLLTAVPLRDQLFDRLCAMGGQKWEVW
ncbi:hypothetical protein PG993_000106 [Apiospora rasikravindrae]|uniref:Uncharacterized protein n=1 Tax=Apiospora rasikravindrae TaxID=990691 RepID=A0ABR1U7L9_9PEZI